MITDCPICNDQINKWDLDVHDIDNFEVHYYWSKYYEDWRTGIVQIYLRQLENRLFRSLECVRHYDSGIYLDGIVPLDKQRIEALYLLRYP